MKSQKLRVGLTCSLTGRYRDRARPVYRSLQLWHDRCNAVGGISACGESHWVELEVRDDQSDPSRVRNQYQQLIRRDVDLVFGPYGSDLTRAALDVAWEHDCLLWNHGGASDELHGRGTDFPISVLAPCSTYFIDLPRLMDQHDLTSLGLVRSNRGNFAPGVARGLRQTAKNRNLSVHEYDYNPASEEISDPLDKATDTGVDVLVLVSSFRQEIEMIRSIRNRSYTPHLIAAVGAGVDLFRQEVGELAEGILGTCQWHPGADHFPDRGPESDEFCRAYGEHWGQPPNYPAAQAYACGLVAEAVLERAGSLDPEELREISRSLRFSTFYGTFKLESRTGLQIGKRPELVQWQNGERRLVTPGKEYSHFLNL